MEKPKQITAGEQKDENGSPGERVVKLSPHHGALLLDGLSEINRDKSFKRNISLKRYVEKLIEDHRKECIEGLKKEREGSEDWLKAKHKREAPDMPFFDWMKAEISREEQTKGSARAKTKPQVVPQSKGGAA